MSKRSMVIKRKFRDCFGLTRTASLAAAAALAMTTDAYAEPVLVPVDEVILPDGANVYDLDGDGNYDVSITSDISFICDVRITPISRSDGAITLRGDVLLDPGAEQFALAHERGEFINPLAQGSGSSLLLAENGSGPFYDQATAKFAGFSFYPSIGDTLRHWAWAQVNVETDCSVHVVAFGYEDEPETPIAAGNQTVPVGSVLPFALGLLAAGAWKMRKRPSSD